MHDLCYFELLLMYCQRMPKVQFQSLVLKPSVGGKLLGEHELWDPFSQG